MKIVKIKTEDGELDLNVHNEDEKDIIKDPLDDTIDLSNMVINYEEDK